MITQIAKWGNSLAVRIPRNVVRDAGLREGERIEVSVSRDGAVILRRARRAARLADLVARITPENRHGESDWGPPVGNEEP
jgi:antitoxin MazE